MNDIQKRIERPDLLATIGGLLFAAGAVALFLRKSNAHAWGDFGRLLILLIPCLVLYALGAGLVAARSRAAGDQGQAGGNPALLVFAILLVPLTLFQFLKLVNGNTDDSLNQAWIFLLTAVVAAAAARRAGLSYGALLASLALVFSWLAFWDKVLDNPSGTTFRWLLVIIALLLVVAAVAVSSQAPRHAVDVVTGAGVAAVIAGFFGIAGVGIALATRAVAGPFGPAPSFSGVRQHMEWDLFLLIVSLALIVYSSRVNVRGPGYVGAVGLLAFIASIGIQVARLANGKSAEGKLFWWPALLIVVGGGALVLGYLAQSSQGTGPPARGGPPPPPPSPPPPAGGPPPQPAGG
jgi:hypothetical protein